MTSESDISTEVIEMEVDTVVLAIIVISVALTTFVCTILGKFCTDQFVKSDSEERKRRNRSRSRRTLCHCHRCPGQGQFPIDHPVPRRTNGQIAINLCHGSGDNFKLQSFAQLAPAAAVSDTPSQTFARLGIRSSKESKQHDLDLPNQGTTSSEINYGGVVHLPSGVGRLFQAQSRRGAQTGGSFIAEYEDLNTIARDPGDGEQRDDEDAKSNTPPSSSKSNSNGKKPAYDRVKPGSTGLTPFKDTRMKVQQTPIDVCGGNGFQDASKFITPVKSYVALLPDCEEGKSAARDLKPIMESAEEQIVDMQPTEEESTYEQPIEVYEVNNDVFLPSQNHKRFSYPSVSKHCTTCSCHYHKINENNMNCARALQRKLSQEIFENESARKESSTLSSSVFKYDEKNSEINHQRKLCVLDFQDE